MKKLTVIYWRNYFMFYPNLWIHSNNYINYSSTQKLNGLVLWAKTTIGQTSVFSPCSPRRYEIMQMITYYARYIPRNPEKSFLSPAMYLSWICIQRQTFSHLCRRLTKLELGSITFLRILLYPFSKLLIPQEMYQHPHNPKFVNSSQYFSTPFTHK